MEALPETESADDVPLPTPRALREAIPLPVAAHATVERGRDALRAILHGRDRRRLAVLVGPCSIHDVDGALDYATRLGELAPTLEGELVVVLRAFVEKPRTSVGWKGLANDPHLDGSCDVAEGLRLSREFLVAVNALGLPCATEILGAFTAPFLEDTLAWAGIGARTCASAVHREIASGLPCPVGFKNATDGSVGPARHGVQAARTSHVFPALDADARACVRRTAGNPDAHLVLRGGETGPNHGAACIREAARGAGETLPARPIVVDLSHGNSGKDPRQQPRVARALLEDGHAGRPELAGLMLESYLEPGRQALGPRSSLRPGVSITDGCLGWSETADLLCEIAASVKRAR